MLLAGLQIPHLRGTPVGSESCCDLQGLYQERDASSTIYPGHNTALCHGNISEGGADEIGLQQGREEPA